MKKHHLKTLPHFFALAWAKRKPVEIRFNDRDFQIGDEIYLIEQDPNLGPSGRIIVNKVREVWTGLPGLERGYAFLVLDQIQFQGQSQNGENTIIFDDIGITIIANNPTPPSAGLPKGDIES